MEDPAKIKMSGFAPSSYGEMYDKGAVVPMVVPPKGPSDPASGDQGGENYVVPFNEIVDSVRSTISDASVEAAENAVEKARPGIIDAVETEISADLPDMVDGFVRESMDEYTPQIVDEVSARIPTQVSLLENDAGYATTGAMNAALTHKQDTIQDLSVIRSGAVAGATAVQPGSLATVATSGRYNDLEGKPEIPAAQVNADWNASSGVAAIRNKPDLAAVATTGDYEDLIHKPPIPAAQVNADWNADSGVAKIKNKPVLASVATSGNYSDLAGKPSIPAKTSDLDNDSGFITISSVPTSTSELTNDSGFITASAIPPIPSKTSDLDNDSGFITLGDVPVIAITEEELDEFPLEDIVPIAANTARFRFSNPEYDPTVDENLSGTNEYVTWSKVTEMEGNVWDGRYDDPDWSYLYEDGFKDGTNLVDIIAFGDLSAVENLDDAFAGCESLISIAEMDIPSCTNLACMFGGCFNLTSVGGFKHTNNVTTTDNMFWNCNNITQVPLFDTGSVTDMNSMFGNCHKLVTIPQYDTGSVTNMMWMFTECHELTSIPALDTRNVLDMQEMFIDCYSLTAAPALDLSSCTCLNSMFLDCNSLVDMYPYDTRTVEDFSSFVAGCTSLSQESLSTINGFNYSSVKYLGGMFARCTQLTTTFTFDTSNAVDMGKMYSGCTGLITAGTFAANNCRSIYAMFYGCTSLTNLPDIEWPNGIRVTEAFWNCVNVSSNILSTYNKLKDKVGQYNHGMTFRNCGSNTTAGSAELAQIPSDWK